MTYIKKTIKWGHAQGHIFYTSEWMSMEERFAMNGTGMKYEQKLDQNNDIGTS